MNLSIQNKNIKRRVAIVLVFITVLMLLMSSSGVCFAGSNSLWEIKSKNSSVFLLGSIHLLNKDSYPLDQSIENAYQKSQVVMFETDLAKMSSPRVKKRIVDEGFLPSNQTLSSVLSKNTYRSLTKLVLQSGLSMASFSRLKPWLCAMTLTLMEEEKLGFLPQYGIDNYFYEKARVDRKRILALESVDDQLSLFSGLDSVEQERMLNQTILEMQVIKKNVSKMISYWKTGKSQRFAALIQEGFKGQPEMYNKFIIDRNNEWLPIIVALVEKNESALVVVGNAHLVGDGSVIDLLKKRGYDVIQK